MLIKKNRKIHLKQGYKAVLTTSVAHEAKQNRCLAFVKLVFIEVIQGIK
jgi:hypothetical protein